MAGFWEDNPISNLMGGIGDAFNWGGQQETDTSFFGPPSTLANNGTGINGSGAYGGTSGWGNDTGGGGFLGMNSWGDAGGLFQGIGAGLQGYAALKGMGLAEDQFDFSKEMFNANYLAQAKAYNNQLFDRQKSRYGGADPSNNPYTHPDEKLSRWGVSEKSVG